MINKIPNPTASLTSPDDHRSEHTPHVRHHDTPPRGGIPHERRAVRCPDSGREHRPRAAREKGIRGQEHEGTGRPPATSDRTGPGPHPSERTTWLHAVVGPTCRPRQHLVLLHPSRPRGAVKKKKGSRREEDDDEAVRPCRRNARSAMTFSLFFFLTAAPVILLRA